MQTFFDWEGRNCCWNCHMKGRSKIWPAPWEGKLSPGGTVWLPSRSTRRTGLLSRPASSNHSTWCTLPGQFAPIFKTQCRPPKQTEYPTLSELMTWKRGSEKMPKKNWENTATSNSSLPFSETTFDESFWRATMKPGPKSTRMPTSWRSSSRTTTYPRRPSQLLPGRLNQPLSQSDSWSYYDNK